MRALKTTNAFKRDYKRIVKRGYAPAKLERIIHLLATDQDLPRSARPHKLTGNYDQFWECHIEPDWLLIYELVDGGLLVLRRTGSHADLFE